MHRIRTIGQAAVGWMTLVKSDARCHFVPDDRSGILKEATGGSSAVQRKTPHVTAGLDRRRVLAL